MRAVVMSVAGSDSGGGAGVQADLRAFSANGVYGTTVLTATTAQNLDGVADVHGIPVEHVRAQLRAVLDGYPVAAAKTGMLWSEKTIDVVADTVRQSSIPWVVDPVMVATSGAKLLQDDAIALYRKALIPRATLVTPNLDEAAVLLEVSAIEDAAQDDAARELAKRHDVPFLLKGGHRRGELIDVLAVGGTLHRFPAERRELNTHGSGCALSAALAARLARGESLVEAVGQALEYMRRAVRHPHRLQEEVSVLGLEETGADQPRGRS